VRLGVFYLLGRSVPQDPVRAHMWFTVAARVGLPAEVVVNTRDRTAAALTPAQRAAAEAAAATCFESKFTKCGEP
jgi:TPR repeat protein